MSELRLNTDGHIIKLGADNDVSLTHVHNTGLLLNSTRQLQFNDASQNINAPSATVLDINATDEIELNATLVDINANVEISGTATTTGVHTFSATPVFPDGSLALADLDIDGGTDIGAAIVDADLFIIDDGAGGTNRKTTAARIKTYIGSFDADAAQVFNESSNDVDFRIESNGNANMFIVNGGNDLVGIASDPDLGKALHIKIADAGSVTPNTDADEFIIENSASAGMTILTGTSTTGAINFADSGNANAGVFRYDHANDSMDFFTAGSERANFNSSGLLTLLNGMQAQDNIQIIDDKGILFGTGDDMYIGTNGGETELSIGKGSTTTGGTTGRLNFIPTTDGTYLDLFSTEGKGPAMGMLQDDGDDNDDYWRQGQGALDGDANISYTWGNYTSGSWVAKMRLSTGGILQHSGSHSASHGFDYAEYWPWKTELANDAKITETYGMTVVLDGATVRLAETGEEAKVIGVVRPNNTSTSTGGDAGLYYINKYERNVWGETQFEEYTQVTWEDTYNDIVIKHFYMKDRIPAKRIRHGAVQSQENWHTLESNFLKDSEGNFVTLVVPSTNAEKSAANYVERTTYTKDKGEHKKDDKLMREKINSSYDFTKSKSYLGRDKRRKEWCIVGLMGQVEIRDSAIVPTSWTKMKNLETGIDLYYIK